MTSQPPIEPLEAFPIPDAAIVLPPALWQESSEEGERENRRLALAALRQAMTERQLRLPLGPEIDPEDPERLLALNRFALQLLTTGFCSDEVSFSGAAWRQPETAPQLLLVAGIDDEQGVVNFPGVLTAAEVVAAVGVLDPTADQVVLPIQAFRGGIERLFTLVQLLDPAAIPRQALVPASADAAAVPVLDWLRGLLPPSLGELGAALTPVTAGAFRQGAPTADGVAAGALAILAIPLGLTTGGDLISGDASRGCIERFQLLLIPTATAQPGGRAGGEPSAEWLTLRLVGDLQGDLLPDGLVLSAVQGSRRQSVTSATSTLLELELPAAAELIAVTLTPPHGTPLVLPPLQLPAG